MRRLLPVIAALTATVLANGLVAPIGAAAADGHYWVDQLRAEQAWTLSTGTGTIVGVLDTGVNASHPNLAGAVLAGRPFLDLGEGVSDAAGHGTAVALLIAGRGLDGATKGIAPDAMILPVTTSGTAEAVNEAVRWLVDQRVSVINMSIGRSRVTGRSAALFNDAMVAGPVGDGDFHRGDPAAEGVCSWAALPEVCLSRSSFHPNNVGTTGYAAVMRAKLDEVGYQGRQ